ncbi:Uncharacterised protein [Chlamydia trachomatis]|nr:Uncharacterised protein [Chlamydia trachomatis]
MSELLQSFHSLVCQEKVLAEIHGFHHIGSNERCNHHIEYHVGNNCSRISSVSYQDNSSRNEDESKGIDSKYVKGHWRAPHKRTLDDKVAVAYNAIVEAFEREDRLLEHLDHGNTSNIFHGLCPHLLLRIKVKPLKLVVLWVHHISHNTNSAYKRYHCSHTQLPIH